MKIIRDKKLFGIINSIDILLVIILLVAGIVVYSILFKSDVSTSIDAKYYKTIATIRLDDMPLESENYAKVGLDLYDNETNSYIGKITKIESGEYYLIKNDYQDGKFVKTAVPNKENLYITFETEVSDQGADLITANNYYIKVGKSLSVRSGMIAGSGYIISIDRGDK